MAQLKTNVKTEVKPTLVFLPGTLCTSGMFQSLLSSDYYQSEFIDLTEQVSLAETSELIKQKVANAPIILVGFSMGGMLAFDFIRRYPKQVIGLCLLNSNCHADLPGRKAGREQHFLLAQQQGIAKLMHDIYLPLYFSKPNNPFVSQIVAMAEQIGITGFKAQLNILSNRPDSQQTLNAFSPPILIIGGEDDLLCPVPHQEYMAEQCSNSELHIIRNAGHFAPLEQSEQVKTLIEHWVIKHYV